MDDRQSKSVGRLWLEAARRRWSLRLAAGESKSQLAWLMLRWLCRYPRQTQWLRTVDDCAAMRRAARTDPRLYERWHRPCISPRFGPAARRRIIATHYAFVQHRLPARMRERVLHGQDIHVATLRLEGEAPVSLHLRKPTRADAGELALLLLAGDKAVLATCALTFAGDEGLLVAPMPAPAPRADKAAMRAFLRGSHGLHPCELLQALARELATFHQLACVHVTPLHQEHNEAVHRHDTAPAAARAFCRDACATFLAAFHGPARHLPQPSAKSAGTLPVRPAATLDPCLLAGPIPAK